MCKPHSLVRDISEVWSRRFYSKYLFADQLYELLYRYFMNFMSEKEQASANTSHEVQICGTKEVKICGTKCS